MRSHLLAKKIIDTVTRQARRVRQQAQETLFETTIRLGVTGLSHAGKTVFITSLVENLLSRDRMVQFKPAAQGVIEAAYLQPQPDRTVPRFQFETHLDALTGADPVWPQSTRSISQLRLSLRVRPRGVIGNAIGPRLVHIDIVDYPGEWLLDLPLLNQSYAAWSKAALKALEKGAYTAEAFSKELDKLAAGQDFDEALADRLAATFTDHLRAARQQGMSALAPGRFLMPGDMEGAPAMSFAPLPSNQAGTLAQEMENRFEAYKSKVVYPFFRDHFARLDRQVVLMDVLGALDDGPMALGDLQKAMQEILECFKTGENTILSRLFNRRIDRILFAATKADHIHHGQHPALNSLVQAMVRRAREKAQFKGAQTRSLALASFRSTAEKTRMVDGQPLETVEGRLASSGKLGASFAGVLVNDPAEILTDAKAGQKDWSSLSYKLQRFLPPLKRNAQLGGLPHIRLDEVAEFLLGDKI